MDLKQLFNDDDAVSPVIGVILMVAITVILAAVIASFVLGLGDSAAQETPTASFSFDFEADNSAVGGNDLENGTAPSSGEDGLLTVTHDGGDSIESDNLQLNDGGNQGPISPWSNEVTAGVSVTVEIDNTDTVSVIWTGDSGDTSSALATYEAPEA